MEDKIGGGEVDGVFDQEAVDEDGRKGSQGRREMEIEQAGFLREPFERKVIAMECSFELAEFFLLIVRKRNPRAGHVFEEF